MTIGNPGGAQINTLGPDGKVTTTGLPGSSPTNVGSITSGTSTKTAVGQGTSTAQGTNQAQSGSQGTTGGVGGSSSQSGSSSYIPDFGPQLDFLNQFGNLAGDLSSNQYGWAQDQFQNNSALTNQNINSYLEQGDLASTGAQRDFANYNDIFNPAASSLTDDWQSYASPDRISAEMGSAEAGTAQSFEAQRANAERDLQSYGLNPGDPRYQGAVQASRTAQAAASAGAGVQARVNTENTARNLRGQALQVASQLPGQTATEQNVAMQGYTGAQNAGIGNTSLGALTMGTTPQYLSAGVANTKFQPLGNVTQGSTDSSNLSYGQNSADSSSYGQNTSSGQNTSNLNENSVTNSGPVLNTTPYTGFHYAEGGAIPDDQGGGYVPADMSPSGGQQTDDIPAVINQTGGQARLNADEFVVPQDITRWFGQKFFQDLIMKARKAMGNPNQAPARATMSGDVQHHAGGGPAGQSIKPGMTIDQVNANMAGSAPGGGYYSGPMMGAGPNGPSADYHQSNNTSSFVGAPPKATDGPYNGAGLPPDAKINGTGGNANTSGPRLDGGAPTPYMGAGTPPLGAASAGWTPSAPQQPMRLNPQNNQWEPDVGQTNNRVQEKPSAPPTSGPAPQVSHPAPQVSRPAPQASQPAPAPMQHTASGAIPTMSQYRGGAGTMSNGGGSMAARGGVNPGQAGSGSIYGQGRYGFGISGGGIGARSQPGQQFAPQQSYYSQPKPFSPSSNPGWSNVANVHPSAPPTQVAPPAKANVPPFPGPTGPAQPAPGPTGPSTFPTAPTGPTTPAAPSTPNVGAVGKGMNNDGQLHPMLPNDLDQLLTSGDEIAKQNAAVYGKHGIPMPGGVTFGNPNDPTSFAYKGNPLASPPPSAPTQTNSGQRGMFG